MRIQNAESMQLFERFTDCRSYYSSKAVVNEPVNKSEYTIGSYTMWGFLLLLNWLIYHHARMAVIVIAAAHVFRRRWG